MLEQTLKILLIDQLCLHRERYIKNITGLSSLCEKPFKDNRRKIVKLYKILESINLLKRLCKDIDITDRDLISKATYKCLKNKYKRNDTLELFSSISGLTKNQIYTIYYRYRKKGMRPFVEILIDVLRNELINKDVNFIPIWYKDKIDACSGKLRHIGIQNIKHQIYDYIAIEGLQPLFKRIGSHQYASIKGRGQIAGVRKIKRWVRNKSLKYFAKLDIKKCYPSIPKDKLIEFLEKHIKNDMLIWLITILLNSFDKGLSIGSFLSQYLCNVFLSQIYHFIGHQHKIRKCRNGTYTSVSLVNHHLFYMDDIFLMGTCSKNLLKSIKLIISYCKEKLGLIIKENWFIRKIPFTKNKNEDRTFIDMMGFNIYRNHITIRKSIFKRIRSVYMKVYKSWKTHKKISLQYSRKCLSYYGLFKNSDSFTAMKKYHVKDVMKICKKVVSNYEKSKIFYQAKTY